MRNTPAPTLYLTLGVPPAASEEAIRKAFQRVARELHPDVVTLQAPAAMEAATARLDAANAAYNMLKSAPSRALYDAQLALLYDPCGKCKGGGQQWAVGGDTYVPCRECSGIGWWQKER